MWTWLTHSTMAKKCIYCVQLAGDIVQSSNGHLKPPRSFFLSKSERNIIIQSAGVWAEWQHSSARERRQGWHRGGGGHHRGDDWWQHREDPRDCQGWHFSRHRPPVLKCSQPKLVRRTEWEADEAGVRDKTVPPETGRGQGWGVYSVFMFWCILRWSASVNGRHQFIGNDPLAKSNFRTLATLFGSAFAGKIQNFGWLLVELASADEPEGLFSLFPISPPLI